ncbi:MAG: hypothetical protein N4A49_16790 [Marinifilaceae bacterium]|jgi:hypothetical protein|nr:hypothetical protein [Marinifilaceae bacterium]
MTHSERESYLKVKSDFPGYIKERGRISSYSNKKTASINGFLNSCTTGFECLLGQVSSVSEDKTKF